MRRLVPRSFRQQIVVLTTAVTAFAMVLLAVVLQLVLAAQTQRDVDRVLEDRADAVISSTVTADGALSVPDERLDAGVAVYDDTGNLVAGSAPDRLGDTYRDLSRTGTSDSTASTQIQTVDELTRVLAEPFTTSDGTAGVVIVTENLAPYEEAERLALIVSLVTGLLTTAAAAGIGAWATSKALRPVATMALTADDWSEHDLSRRFGLGAPTNEITALAHTLDSLLEKVSTAIRSEQRLTSELAHELRTPLSAIQGSADLALMRGELPPDSRADVEEIAAASRRMSGTITTLLDVARSEASMAQTGRCSLIEVAADALRDAGIVPDETVVDLPDLHLAAPHVVALRALGPVVANAAQHATSRIRISATEPAEHPVPTGPTGPIDVGELVDIVVDNDGQPIDSDLAQGIFEPGTTGGAGSGLGLPIARRMARSVGGDVVLDQAQPAGGIIRFHVLLPRG